MDHDFILLRTDLPEDDLPMASAQVLVEDERIEVVEEEPRMAPGASYESTVDLEPGPYVLICNVPGHYELGMRATLTAQ